MPAQRTSRQHVSQKALAAIALVLVAAIAFVPPGKARAQTDTVSSADSSRSLAAR